MNPSTDTAYDFTSVEPSLVYSYLQNKGWRETDKIDDRASILTTTSRGKKMSILLPLRNDIPDFESRMYDVLKVLELVEGRPSYELLPLFVNPDLIAIERDCEVFSLKFKFIHKKNEYKFPAKQMGLVLASLQDLFDAVGQAESGNYSSLGQIQREIAERTELAVFETFKGSFGVKLALAPHEAQLNLLERPLAERVSASFLELVKRSNEGDKAALKHLLQQLKKRGASRYRKFLVNLIGANVDFDVSWGSVNPQGGGRAFLAYENTVNTVEFINKMEKEDPDEYQIDGELISASKRRNSLEIEAIEDEQKYICEISEAVVGEANVELTIGRLYSVKFQEVTSINPATGEEKNERTVISISYLERGQDTIVKP